MINEQEFSRFRSVVDPFQEGQNGGRLRALGLKRLYIEMADPTLDKIRGLTNALVKLPADHLRILNHDAMNASYDPQYYFGERNVPIDDERIFRGAGYVGTILDDLYYRYEPDGDQLRWGQTLDPEELAQHHFERIQLQDGEQKLQDFARQVHDESDLGKRQQMGLDLKQKIMDYIGSFNFTFHWSHESEKPVEPTWNHLSSLNSTLQCHAELSDGTITSSGYGLCEPYNVAEAAIQREPFERRLREIPHIDQERFNQLRSKYGAKAANLILLSHLVNKINGLRDNQFRLNLEVPDFRAVSVDVFRNWKAGKPFDDQLRVYFDWASKLRASGFYGEIQRFDDYMIRSSAVLSEDGENATGAGIYNSVFMTGGSTYEEFKAAVAQVYESVNSPNALVYREQYGIEDEEMGLVIQRHVTSHSSKPSDGYINSVMPGVPKLMEVATGLSRNFVNRNELDFYLAVDEGDHERAFEDVNHFRPDIYKVDRDLPSKVAQVTYVLERIWGRPVQAEFVYDFSTVHLVQVRELPSQMFTDIPEVKFPDTPHIHSGSSLGVGDLELPVLDDRVDNRENVGVVVFRSNYGKSMDDNSIHLPKEGAVIIADSGGAHGHLQTLCAEKGLLCVFPGPGEGTILRYSDLINMDKVRVVSNGLEGRVYNISEV